MAPANSPADVRLLNTVLVIPVLAVGHQKKIALTVPHTCERQDAIGRASSSAGVQFCANAGGIVNLNDIFIATERKKRNADIILLEKQKKQYDNYVALADKVKDLVAQKHDKGIDVYTHDHSTIEVLSRMKN